MSTTGGVAEANARLDYRDAHTMAQRSSLEVPECKGVEMNVPKKQYPDRWLAHW